MGPPCVAVLTGEGLGAVAVVRVWGDRAVRVVDLAFRPHRGVGLAASIPRVPRIGRVGVGLGDEVVAIVISDDLSEVEVHCHGGPAAVALVVEGLVKAGANLASPAQSARNQAGSKLRAEAMQVLPSATTLKAATHLLDQANGALDLELELVLRDLESHPEFAMGRIASLLDLARFGTRLATGWRVVLAGRPNVGKSRLLNALAGFDRAIVDPTPGTTRDVVSLRTAFAGWPVELADTAGLRQTNDPIEAAGVLMAQSRQQSADLVLLVLDRSEPLSVHDHRLMAEHPDALLVANKGDLAAAWDGVGLVVSAERGDGIDRLATAIGDRLVPVAPPAGSPLPFHRRHVRRLTLIRSAIERRKEEWASRILRHWLRRPSQ